MKQQSLTPKAARRMNLERSFALLLILAVLLAWVGVQPTYAAGNITVDSLADTVANDSACTLREAITNANGDDQSGSTDCAAGSGADTITFSVDGTITLGSTLPEITSEMTIDGAGQFVTVSGGNAYRVMVVNASGALNLNALTIADGFSGSEQGGGILNYGTLTVSNSTFSGNSSEADGGAISNRSTLLIVNNSTFFGNSAGASGGGIYGFASANVSNSTFSDNSASYGGAGIATYSTITLRNTIVANSLSGSDCIGVNQGYIIADSYNLASDGSCDNATTQTAAQLNLGSLANNGGETQTIALLAGSTAIDAGDNAAANAAGLTTDQRGAPRFNSGTVDVGAFELQQVCPAGKYDNGSGCVDADPGYYVPASGATEQLPCPVGTYQPNSGSTSCDPADPGYYVDTVGSVAQTACSLGYYQPNSASTSCDPANPGYYVDAIGSASQTACLMGYYQPNSGSNNCIAADPGHYVDVSASTTQTACVLGTYQPNAGATSCFVADPGYYVDVTAATEQTPCPSGTTSGAGATECTPIATGFPTTSILDDFNRSNGKVGNNWALANSRLQYKIASNTLDVQLGGALIWKPNSFGTSQEAFITLTNIAQRSPTEGLLLKAQAGDRTEAGVIIVVYDARANAVRVSTLRKDQPAWTNYGDTPATFADGDQLGARALADGNVEVYQNGTLIATVTLNAEDQAFFDDQGGRIGIWTLAAPNAVLDDFGGGDATLP